MLLLLLNEQTPCNTTSQSQYDGTQTNLTLNVPNTNVTDPDYH